MASIRKHTALAITAFLITSSISCSCIGRKAVVYASENTPGDIPVLFCRQAISLPGRFEQNITFSPDGREYYFGTADSKDWWYRSILRTRFTTPGKFVTDTPDFVRNFNFAKEKFIGEPYLSPDGNQLFFVAGFQPDIWITSRDANSDWAPPVLLDSPVNTPAGEWNPSVAAGGTLYFASTRSDSGRIYKSERQDGRYPRVELLKGPISLDDAGDPCISQDEKTLVFSSWKTGGRGGTDLYVCYAEDDGNWSTPIPLGDNINTEHEEVGPRISPDGKYLFFHRRDKWKDATMSDIYWVHISVLPKRVNKGNTKR